uniref:EamA domain-containing protein n=1 Tax=Tetraselmis sp. GSL018 TaxID=582737 RepID=A0A061R1I1_9CHLO
MVSGIATKKISFDVACCSVRTGYSVTLPRAFLETASSGWSRRVCARQNYSLSKQSVKLFTRNQIDKHFKSGRLMRSVETQLPRLLNCSRGDYDYSSRDSETNSSTFTAEATKGKPDVYPDETDNEIELELENTTEALQATEQPPQSQWFHVGTFALVAVAFLWGTYTPVLRFLYANPGAPSPSMLTATRGILGSLILGLSSLLVRQPVLPPSDDARAPSGSQPPADPEQDPAAKFEAVSRPGGPIGWLKGLMSSTTDRLWLAAAEMGTWNFLGTALQAIGLEYTTATRAAFIIQSTALFTPLISSLAGERLTQGTLMGCSAAMMGTLLVTAEHSGSPVTQAVEAASICEGCRAGRRATPPRFPCLYQAEGRGQEEHPAKGAGGASQGLHSRLRWWTAVGRRAAQLGRGGQRGRRQWSALVSGFLCDSIPAAASCGRLL